MVLVLSKLVVAVVVMVLLAVSVTPRHRLSKQSGDKHHDVLFGPQVMHWLGLTSGLITLAVVFSFTLVAASSGLRSSWSWVDAAAAVAAVAGFCLRLWAMAELGPLFTFAVGIRSKHALVTSGPYRVLRHPSYTGMVLGCAGYVVFVHLHEKYALALAVQAVMLLCFLFVRIRNEERVLKAEFGRAWDAHCARTWRLLPYVF